MVGYYDGILVAIPSVMVGSISLHTLAGTPLAPAVIAGGLLTALLVGHALFIRSPTTPSHPTPSSTQPTPADTTTTQHTTQPPAGPDTTSD